MENKEKTKITVSTSVNAKPEKVWKYWTEPQHITQWCTASADWHTPRAENDVTEGGRFVTRMEAKDGSMGFDFGGTNNIVREREYLSYTMDDGRTAEVIFTPVGSHVEITETFEAEDVNPVEMQRSGWQAILDNFKKHTEEN